MTDRGAMQIYPDPAALARALADLFVSTGRAAISERGSFHVALSGGNTPRAGYELLAQPPLRDEISWQNVHIYFGDERCVPPTDDRSNYAMAKHAFLDAVGIPKANVHRIVGEIDPGHAANEYASLLRAVFGSLPHLDLVLLGIGPDGHTASLFPGSSPVIDDDALVRAVYAQSQEMWRVTITPKVINSARTVAFAVEGTDKAKILPTIYRGPIDTVKYPAQIVAPNPGQLIWLVDDSAAALL
jgi:6-phosphogluconolactonase